MYIFVDISLIDRYISEKPKGRANKSKERAKRRVGMARSKKEGMGGPPPPPKRGQFGSYDLDPVSEYNIYKMLIIFGRMQLFSVL